MGMNELYLRDRDKSEVRKGIQCRNWRIMLQWQTKGFNYTSFDQIQDKKYINYKELKEFRELFSNLTYYMEFIYTMDLPLDYLHNGKYGINFDRAMIKHHIQAQEYEENEITETNLKRSMLADNYFRQTRRQLDAHVSKIDRFHYCITEIKKLQQHGIVITVEEEEEEIILIKDKI